MKIVKFLFWGIVIGFVAMVISSNIEFFASRQSLDIGIGYWGYRWEYRTPETFNGVIFVAFFIGGGLASYMTNVVERFGARKTIRSLNRTCDAQNEEISILKGKLAAAMGDAPAPPNPSPTQELKQK